MKNVRPTFDSIYLDFAEQLAKRSTCTRLQVGCVITSIDHTRVFAIGYNGNAHGLGNKCDSTEPGNCGCLHAEENAIIHCSEARETPKIVYCTHLPCKMCAKRLIQLGNVKRVIFKNWYRIVEGKDVLVKGGIEVWKNTDLEF